MHEISKCPLKLVILTILIFLISNAAIANGQIRQTCQDTEDVCTPSLRDCSDNGPKPLKDVFFDDFKGGPQTDWTLRTGWSVKRSDGNDVLRGSGHWFAALEDQGVNNYAFKSRFKRIKGGIHINVRNSENLQRYFVNIGVGHQLSLTKQIGNNFIDLVKTDWGQGWKWENWHDIEIRANGGNIRVFIDDNLCICYKDRNPILAGGVSFETLDDSEFLIDDVRISKL
jgi:hypothetical protein